MLKRSCYVQNVVTACFVLLSGGVVTAEFPSGESPLSVIHKKYRDNVETVKSISVDEIVLSVEKLYQERKLEMESHFLKESVSFLYFTHLET